MGKIMINDINFSGGGPDIDDNNTSSNTTLSSQKICSDLGDQYNESTSYTVGQYCIYSNTLYKCIEATTGSFDSTKWSSTTVSGEISNLNANKLSKSADTMTGNLSLKCSDIDASQANNGVTSVQYPTSFNILDTGERILARQEGKIEPNGNIGSYWYVRNYNTSGGMVAEQGIAMSMNKSGALSWTVDYPENFRTAIGLSNATQYTFMDWGKSVTSTFSRNFYIVADANVTCYMVWIAGPTGNLGISVVDLANNLRYTTPSGQSGLTPACEDTNYNVKFQRNSNGTLTVSSASNTGFTIYG